MQFEEFNHRQPSTGTLLKACEIITMIIAISSLVEPEEKFLHML